MIVQLPFAATVPLDAVMNDAPPLGVNVMAVPPEVQVDVGAGVPATTITGTELTCGKGPVTPIPPSATVFGLLMVTVSVVAAPPNTAVELLKDLVIVGAEMANAFTLWLTSPLLDTDPPSLPVTAPFRMV